MARASPTYSFLTRDATVRFNETASFVSDLAAPELHLQRLVLAVIEGYPTNDALVIKVLELLGHVAKSGRWGRADENGRGVGRGRASASRARGGRAGNGRGEEVCHNQPPACPYHPHRKTVLTPLQSTRSLCVHQHQRVDIDNELLGPVPAEAVIYSLAANTKFLATNNQAGVTACLMLLANLARYGTAHASVHWQRSPKDGPLTNPTPFPPKNASNPCSPSRVRPRGCAVLPRPCCC